MNDNEMARRNIDLNAAFMQYALDHPEILDTLPPDFQLVVLPEDDPELARRNQELLKRHDFAKPVVLVRMKTPKPAKMRVYKPKVQVLEHA